jgi:mRNA interferase RelE/StbE
VAEYRILLKSSAAKEIEGIGPKEDRRRVVKKIGDLAANPRTRGTEKLAGHEDRYRIRQGTYRIVYLIDDFRREVIVFRVGHRKDVYR